MTNLILKCGKQAVIHTFLVIGFMLSSSSAIAQLDSVAVSGISFTQELSLDSLGNSDTLDIINIEVFANDIDFLGEVLVTIYDQTTDFPIALVKASKAELLSENAISGFIATIEVPDFSPIVGRYRIEVQVRNFQGGNLPLLTATY